MKKRSYNSRVQVLKNTFLLMLLLIGSSVVKAVEPRDAAKTVGVFINDKLIHITKDSVSLSQKGTLTLHGLILESPKAERLRFRVLIRHRNFAGNVLLFPWDEKYNDGEVLNAVELSKILPGTKVGDQLIVIPIDNDSVFEDAHGQFQITVTGGGC